MMRSTAMLGFAVSLFISALSAQEITGNIRGAITDPTGASVPNATITVTNTGQNAVIRTLTTGAGGEYSALLLPVGRYSVKAAAAGFALMAVSNIDLNVNDHLTVNLQMKVGDVSSEVSVEANGLQVDTESPAAAGLINGTQVRELSLNNRNYEQLVALMPGVSTGVSDQIYVGVSNPSGQSNQINFSINGNRPTQNNWTIDGADNVDRGANLTLLNYPSIDSIEEFKVLRGEYSPEFGRSSGGEINVVTRSGNSTFHGSAYEFFRNNDLNANNFFNNRNGIARPPLRYNDFGYTLGGPIFIPGVYNKDKNKSFFFFSEEFRRVITYSTFSSGEVPTAAERQGTFATPVCLNADCSSTGTQVVNINPVAQAYLKDIFSKLPTPGPDGALNFVGRNVYNARQESLRVDHYFSQRFTVMGRYLRDSIPTVEPGGLFTGSALPGVATTKTNAPGHNYVLRAVMTFTPTLINEVGYAFSYGAVVSSPIGLGGTAASPDIKPVLPFASQLGRVPNLAFNDGEGVGGFGPYRDFNRNHNIFDTLSKVLGQHTMKFGFSFNRYQKDENDGGGAAFNTGQYSFNDSDPNGNGTFQQEFANFLTGNVAQFFQTNIDPRAVVQQHQFEMYAQDAWKARPNLTVSYGVRYSLFNQATDAHGRLSSFDPSLYQAGNAPQIDTHGNLVPGTQTPILNGISINGSTSPYGHSIAATPKLNFAPRLGIAWDPFGKGKTSIRTGYGIFYDSPAADSVENNIFTNPPFVQNISISNTVLDNPGSVAPDVNLSPSALFATAAHWKQPYTQQWSFDVQHQLSSTWLLDVGYYGSKGTHLIGVVDINEPFPGSYVAAGLVAPGKFITPGTTQRLNRIRPYQGFEAINQFTPTFTSNYNSLQLQTQKRLSGSSLLVFNYTWSHALTNAQNDFRTPQNTYNYHAEYGPAQFDRRHIVTANYIYELPFFKHQPGFAGHVLGGWEVSGITTINSGLPLTVTGGKSVDPGGVGIFSSSFAGRRPDEVGNPYDGAPHTIMQWFNKTAFANVPAGQYRVGDSPRGAVRGPGLFRWDMSLFKNTKLYERLDAQFRAEAFNMPNHTNLDGVSTSLSSRLFARVVSARDARVFQFGLKLRF